MATAARTGPPTRAGTGSDAGALWATVLLFTGAALAAVSFAGLRWYSVTGGPDSAGNGFTFADLHHDADQLGAPVAAAYFDKLAWGLVAIVVLLGLAGKVRSPVSGLLRLLGFLAGFLGLALTYYALAQLFDAQQAAGGSGHQVLHNASWGLWAAFAGFALAALGAVLGRPASATI